MSRKEIFYLFSVRNRMSNTVPTGSEREYCNNSWPITFFPFFQPDGRKQECVFVEEFLENNYTALVSAKYKGWYLGFNRKGRPKKGSQTTQRQQEVHFMKRQPKGRLDPLEEFRFTTVTKRTRRARRLKPNSKRNWWDQWDSTNFPRGGGGWGELHLQISSCLKRITVTSVKERQTKRTKKVKDVLFLYFQDDWILPNYWIPLGWCHCANVSVMLFILDKLKDLWENSCRRRLRLRLNCKLKACFSFWQWGLKRELTQCYKNQPTRDLLEYLTVFVCVSLHNADPILSTGIRHHGDETERGGSRRWHCAARITV